MTQHIEKYYMELNCPETIDERFNFRYSENDIIINNEVLTDIYQKENIGDCKCDSWLIYKDEDDINMDKFMTGDMIGKGLYGKVFDLCDKDDMKDCKYVIKFDKNGYNCNEISIQIFLGKTGIAPKIYEVWRCLNTKKKTVHSIIVMEKCDISLMDLLTSKELCDYYQNRYGRDIINNLFRKLIKSLREINDSDIIHNDNHLGNFMIKGDDIKIIDFGLSSIVSS